MVEYLVLSAHKFLIQLAARLRSVQGPLSGLSQRRYLSLCGIVYISPLMFRPAEVESESRILDDRHYL